MKKLLAVLLTSTLASQAAMAAKGPSSFVYHGRAYSANGTTPITSSVDVTMSILAANGCLLYEEKQSNIDLSQTNGAMSLQVGSPIGSAVRTGNDPALSMQDIFSNGKSLQGHSCQANGADGDGRHLHVSISVAGGAPQALTPDLPLSSVPMAMVADTIQGIKPADLIQVSANITQNNIESLASGNSSLYAKPAEVSAAISSGTSSLASSSSVTSQISAAVSPLAKQADLNTLSTQVQALPTTSVMNGAISSATANLATQASLSSAIAPLATSASVDSKIAPLATSASVDSKISSAVAPLATSASVTSAIAPLATSASVTSAIAPLATSASVDSKISTATAPLATTVAMNSAISASAALQMPLAGGTHTGNVAMGAGQMSYKVFDAGSNSTGTVALDWNNGQIQKFAYTGTNTQLTINMNNMKDGGSYTLMVNSVGQATSGTAAFNNTDSAPNFLGDAQFKALPDKTFTGGKYTVYNFQRIGSQVFMTNTGPFAP